MARKKQIALSTEAIDSFRELGIERRSELGEFMNSRIYECFTITQMKCYGISEWPILNNANIRKFLDPFAHELNLLPPPPLLFSNSGSESKKGKRCEEM